MRPRLAVPRVRPRRRARSAPPARREKARRAGAAPVLASPNPRPTRRGSAPRPAGCRPRSPACTRCRRRAPRSRRRPAPAPARWCGWWPSR
ncbi:hypothetical protein D7X12_27135 [Corallococcus sicarius]|uniref:Uncharacterized protein n=1 Tax=Corallococcus sicarius TaxID=2316726 RepID=A0A3A8N2A7_9BACT|nr:hypothetical protein D7X12_27135 [Corallococcus sicarius]